MAATGIGAAPANEGGGLKVLARADIGLALGMVVILGVLLMPMPKFLLDIMLSLSITLSVMILMLTLFIRSPLEFSVFPTILLIATMLRLALNLASTRLILARGAEGTDAAGKVIEAFGNFIMQGNVVIGLIVFSILVIVNFIVITKGSGRIAEVAARFTLDSMPGKQMAIDADLSAGLIDETQARERRRALESESNFYGAMDGASKFVRGDAVAGILITVINIIGGMIIGVAQGGLTFADAANTYTVLTIGDGLVSQVPALIVSTAAGLLVSKGANDGPMEKALFAQFASYPAAFGMASLVMVLMAFLPGTPTAIFLALAGACGVASRTLAAKKVQERARTAEAAKVASAAPAPQEEPISTALAMDALRIELGYGLLALINDAKGYRLTDQIKALRRQLASEMGFVMPSVRILDNMQLASTNYSLRVKEVESGAGELKIGQLLVIDPRGGPIQLPGQATREPTFGLPAMWIDPAMREEASFRGYTVVDPATVLTTHLTEVIKDHMAELLSYAETKKLLDELPSEHAKLVEDLVPNVVSIATVQRVLQQLLTERVSIRDLPTILEGIGEIAGQTQNIMLLTEHVRGRLARQICTANANPATGFLPLVTLSPRWEQAFAESLTGTGEQRQLSIAPSKLHEFIAQVRATFDEWAGRGEAPALLTSPGIRPYVRSIVERFRPQTVVLSQNEIHPSARLKTLAQI
ncbi:MAG: flagellar biosynthesis protein FlhA [Alphaproteobacteria bacterium]|nr:flagellar biosynthesis protein FlhA [Alphaproteobacteria bacterium]